MELSAPFRADGKTRVFWAGVLLLLLGTALYAGGMMAAYVQTPLGQRPQGEAAAWLADAESLYRGTMPREPFFRAPAYLTVLALLREVGVPAANLANAARILNIMAHIATTIIVLGIGLRLWQRRGALVAGLLWGFYPPAVFLALQPTPATLALLAWVGGVAAALGTVWQSPFWQGGRLSRRHAWAYPFIAGVAFVIAACFSASLWPTALAWPLIALFLGRDLRASRLLAATFGVGLIGLGVIGLQTLWGGSPQPLAGADLYRLARALEITQPWNAPIPTVEFSVGASGADYLALEAQLSYQIQTKLPAPGLAVLNGYWWRTAARATLFSPSRSVLRATRKISQFFAAPNYSAGPDYSRARAELGLLKYNLLDWGILLVLGLAGVALGWPAPAARLAVLLGISAMAGGILWYPTMEARAPVAVLLAVFAGALPTIPWLWRRNSKVFLVLAVFAACALAWWPRRNSPAPALLARDSRERAMASAASGNYEDALAELVRPDHTTRLSVFEREMAAGWRFQQLLAQLPAQPSSELLEAQLLENGDLARQSVASQFRCGAYLWFLNRTDGAIYYWEGLVNDQGAWGASARMALAESGRETPEDAQRRAAWEIGGTSRPDPALTPFFAFLRANQASAVAPKN